MTYDLETEEVSYAFFVTTAVQSPLSCLLGVLHGSWVRTAVYINPMDMMHRVTSTVVEACGTPEGSPFSNLSSRFMNIDNRKQIFWFSC